MMAAVLYVVGAADPLDQHPVEAAQSTCASPVALRNGDFESPLIADGSVAAVNLPGWQPARTLLRHTGEGQHAELTTGTIHQDLTTVPGQRLHWELRHRGGTLTVLAGAPTAPLAQQGDDITGDRAAWATYAGVYTVPEGQTTTRFALRASGRTGVDAVSFGTPACLITTITASPSTAKVNDRLTYAVTARNAGGNPARSTTITSGPHSQPVGVLRPGQSHTFSYDVRVAPASAGSTIRTRATAGYSTSLAALPGLDDELTSTSNTVSTEIAPAADLTVDATTSPGDVTTYKITTGNKGPSPATAAQVTAALPDGTTAVSASSPGGTCSLTSTTAECTYPTLPPGETRTMTVTAVSTASSTDEITVTASSPTDELTPGDNVIGFDPAQPGAAPPATRPLALAVTTSTPTVEPNGTASFQATVRNDTPTTAPATIRVHPAPGLAITTGTPDQGTYTDGTWTLPGLASGATAHLELTATPLTAGRLSLTVSTTGTKKKATITAAPSSSSLAVTVDRPRSPRPYDVGALVPFRYRLTNNGTDPLDRIVVIDTLSGPATCPATFLAPTATMLCEAPPYTVTQDDVDAAGPLTNIVTAEAYAPDLLFFGPITADIPIVTAVPSLTVASLDGAYLLRNNGNQTLSNVRVTSTTAGRATCTRTVLPPGASTTCTPTNPAALTERTYAYGTAPGATTATAFGPFTTTPRPQSAGTSPTKPSADNGPQDQTHPSANGEAQGQTSPPANGEAQGQTSPPANGEAQGQTIPPANGEAQGGAAPSSGDETQGQTGLPPRGQAQGQPEPSSGGNAQGQSDPPAGTGTQGQTGPSAGGEAQGQTGPPAGAGETPANGLGTEHPRGQAQSQAKPLPNTPAAQSAAQQNAAQQSAAQQSAAQQNVSQQGAAQKNVGQQGAARLGSAQQAPARQAPGQQTPMLPAAPAPTATTAVPARGAVPQLGSPSTPDPSVPNPTPTVITPPPAVVPTREQYWADPIPDPVPFSGSPLATATIFGLALLAGGLIVLASLRGRWWPRKAGKG
ncbi:conserved repeat domain-containing protein [Paractinoplanes atraurantiacus]|uniref:Conserved repeat domain-containing protein n=2 Tax=Paractinoplanes atraurantiacus TaxID=1036182 RepID=A0A285IQ37_9ACTN|nr:conserved repeat domain-containing protein [Actinoplanes atraurantiacus]